MNLCGFTHRHDQRRKKRRPTMIGVSRGPAQPAMHTDHPRATDSP